jgi:hypothetical protein
MIRFDFDVVSDPLPPKPIRPPAAGAQAGVERRRDESEVSGDSEAAKDAAVTVLGEGA